MKDNNKNKNKRLRLFDITRDGKGVSKTEVKNGSLKRFFISYKDNFNKILYVNIFMVLGNFPLIFLIAALSGYTMLESYAPMYDDFQNFAHFFASEPLTPDKMSLFALRGLHAENLVPSTLTYIFYGISALTLFTFGIVNVGTAYILRNIAKGDPVFTWTDFWYAVKRNYKQALPYGIIDLSILAVLIFNIYTMMMGSGSFFANTMFWANIVIFILYFFMRYYIYVQMVTFRLSIFKILKNSLIFALLGIKRNFIAFLGILLGLLLEVALIFGFGGILLPFGVAAPLAILFSSLAYMKVFAAYFKIKEVMIDPYVTDEDKGEEEAIMRDDVTEKQRLEKIKAKNGLL